MIRCSTPKRSGFIASSWRGLVQRNGYVSAWIKCFYPEVFACALLNSQPMGFYAPARIVRDAREHGVEVRPVDINHSLRDCTLEPAECGKWALRLGLRQIKGFAEAAADQLIRARPQYGYVDARALWRRSGLGRGASASPKPTPSVRSGSTGGARCGP
jgi:DNA polymerase III alpha subunit